MPPTPEFEQKKVVSLFAVLAYIGLALAGLWLLYALRALLPPFVVAAIFAMTLAPVVDTLTRRGYKRGLAIAMIYFVFLASIVSIVTQMIPRVGEQMTGLISNVIPDKLRHGSADDIKTLATQGMNKLHVPTAMRPPVYQQAQQVPQMASRVLQWFGGNFQAWAGNLIWVVLVPIITFFLLLDFNKILGKTLILVKRERRDGLLKVVTEMIAVFGNYVRGVLLVTVLDIVVIGIVLYIAGLREFALTLAVTAGLLYVIPYFGALVSTILIAAVTWATQGAATAAGVTVAMIVIHQVIFDNIVAPRIIGGSVNMHPLLTLFALMAGGTLFGIGGTLLAVPIAAAVQVVLVHLFPHLNTSEPAVARAAAVVRTTLARDAEDEKPPLRQSGNAPALQVEAAQARADAKDPPPILPPDAKTPA